MKGGKEEEGGRPGFRLCARRREGEDDAEEQTWEEGDTKRKGS
jgi:hypothetical protein